LATLTFQASGTFSDATFKDLQSIEFIILSFHGYMNEWSREVAKPPVFRTVRPTAPYSRMMCPYVDDTHFNVCYAIVSVKVLRPPFVHISEKW
jgi:hypothetical protein